MVVNARILWSPQYMSVRKNVKCLKISLMKAVIMNLIWNWANVIIGLLFINTFNINPCMDKQSDEQ